MTVMDSPLVKSSEMSNHTETQDIMKGFSEQSRPAETETDEKFKEVQADFRYLQLHGHDIMNTTSGDYGNCHLYNAGDIWRFFDLPYHNVQGYLFYDAKKQNFFVGCAYSIKSWPFALKTKHIFFRLHITAELYDSCRAFSAEDPNIFTPVKFTYYVDYALKKQTQLKIKFTLEDREHIIDCTPYMECGLGGAYSTYFLDVIKERYKWLTG